MKRPIDWHRDCARNARRSLEEEERRLASQQARVEKLREQVDFYDAQVTAAERRGMAEFDRERLLVKRKQ